MLGRVLVVGPESTLRHVVASLRPWHEVVIVGNPEQAFAQCFRGVPFATIVVDLSIKTAAGAMTTTQLLEWLRSARPDVKRVTLSASTPRPRELELSEAYIRNMRDAPELVRRAVHG